MNYSIVDNIIPTEKSNGMNLILNKKERSDHKKNIYMTTLEDKAIWDKAAQDADLADVGEDVLRASTEEIINRTKLLENDIKIMKSEQVRIHHEQNAIGEKIKDNQDKVKLNKQLPYLVANVVEVF